ncbi:MAG: hypothetical protein HY548_07070 [Elusimicrobia bacterium]|nr:hypothetical protein [Elusimicrobiota bacterium]
MTQLPPPQYEVTDDNHRYTIRLPSGDLIGPLVSVTSVLGVLAKDALIGWAARESAAFFKAELLRLGARALTPVVLDQIAKDAAQAHRRKANDAADLGSVCHNAFEAIIKGQEPIDYPKEIEQPISAFKVYRLQSDIEIVATELPVASAELRYGGRLDFIGWSESRGGWGIGDYKTSSRFYGNDYAYQAGGGYARAVEEMYGIEIKWAEIVRFSKKPPFESEARPVTNIRAAIDGFLAALAIVRANEVPLIGAPTFSSAGTAAQSASAKAKRKAALPMGF